MNCFKSLQRLPLMLKRSYMASNSNILKLKSRGMLQTIFPQDRIYDLEKLLTSSPQTFYCGFDPTAESLHLGNLLSVMVLLHCQRSGHLPIAVVGGATALIGDPSGKMLEREPLNPRVVQNNVEGVKRDLETIFKNFENHFHHSNPDKPLPPVQILDNRSWYSNHNVVDFISTTGRMFRMGDMLTRKSVKSRLESEEGLCLSEFLYQVFQAFDWLHLYHTRKCTIQIGGNDQMGNIMAGFNLLGKVFKEQFFGLTTPLITDNCGEKLGKSSGNVLWLNPDKTSPFEFYQFFVRLPDSDVEDYLKLFTFYSEEELLQIMTKQKTNPGSRHAQKTLAKEVVKLVHGEEGLKLARTCTDALYNMNLEKLSNLSRKEIDTIFKGSTFTQLHLEPGMKVLDVVLETGCFGKEEVALRAIKAGGLHINAVKVTNPEHVLMPGIHILPNNLTIIRSGKKNFHIIQWQGTGQSFHGEMSKR